MVDGDGTENLFWEDVWKGEVEFSERFRRLFELFNKEVTIEDMYGLG